MKSSHETLGVESEASLGWGLSERGGWGKGFREEGEKPA